MAEIKFSTRAYCKLILHAAKYPHCAVNGLLLAEEGKSKDEKKSKGLNIVDAIPLFHQCLHLAPMAEIALTQVDQMATSSGLVLAGYYLANENIKDVSYEKGNRIADKIAENFNSACLVVIDNKRLTINMDNVALCVAQCVDGKWKPKDRSLVVVEDNSLDVTESLLQTRAFHQLVDFDNHLDNISLDWRNLQLNQDIQKELDSF